MVVTMAWGRRGPAGRLRPRRLALGVMAAFACAVTALGLVAAMPAGADTVISVTNGGDTGAGTFRAAIGTANAIVGNVTIQFAVSTVVLNRCDGPGEEDANATGDLDYTGPGTLTLQSSTSVTISVAHACVFNDDRILDIRNGAPLVIAGSFAAPFTFSGGGSSTNGGAIRSTGVVIVDRATFSANTATGTGGAIAAASVSLTDSIVSSNIATGNGGGIDATGAIDLIRTTVSANAGARGGGVHAGGAFSATASTLDNNVASVTGGGVHASSATVTNSTIAANTVTGGGASGGGLYATGSVSLTFATIGTNAAAAGANVAGPGTLTAFATAIGAFNPGSGGSSCAMGATVSTGYDLDQSTSCGFGAGLGDAAGVAPLFAPLAANGATTRTMAPVVGSAATDRVPAGTPGCAGTDQRGVPRPLGVGCDVGAFEVVPDPLTVTTTADTVSAADGLLSLREAVGAANAAPGSQTIALVAGATYALTRCGLDRSNVVGSVDLKDAAGATITGGAGTTITTSCDGTSDALVATRASLELDGVTLAHANGSGVEAEQGTAAPLSVTLQDTQINDSWTRGVDFGPNPHGTLIMRRAAITGSGFFAVGTNFSTPGLDLDMVDSEIATTHNPTGDIGGVGSFTSATVTRSSVHDNHGSLFVGGRLTADHAHFDHNSGDFSGVLAHAVTVTDSTFDDNTSTRVLGGGLLLDGVVPGTSSLTRVSISGNSAPTAGGVYLSGSGLNVTIADSHIDHNTATGSAPNPGLYGGLVFNGSSPSSLTITGSTIDGNHADFQSALTTNVATSISTTEIDGNVATSGSTATQQSGTVVASVPLTITNSTVANNVVPATGYVGLQGAGGISSRAPLTLAASTVTGNSGDIGGVWAAYGGTMTASTITGNTGAIAANVWTGDVLHEGATVFGAATGPSCVVAGPGVLVSDGGNFDQTSTCGVGAGVGDIASGGDPQLGPLAANGGPTLTMAPLAGSPLANQIAPTSSLCAGADQRGVARPQGPACDIGAVEGSDGVLAWAGKAGGTGSDLSRELKVDAAGNAYVVGTITGTPTFGTGPAAVTLTTSGPKDAFLAKYAPDGALVWVRQIGSTGSDEGWGLALDPSGNPVVTGNFTGTVSVGAPPLAPVLTGTDDMFVAKFSAVGAPLWARSAGGSDWEQGLGISVDPAGNVFVVGNFASSVATFGTAPGQSVAHVGFLDGFIARYGPNGGLWWVRPITGPGQEFVKGVAARPDGSAAVVGLTDATATFGPAGAGGRSVTAVGGTDGFVALFDASGTAAWATGVSGPGTDLVWGVATDAAGEIYVNGAFMGSAVIGPGGPTLSAAGSTDGFVARLSGAGAVIWAHTYGGSGVDLGIGIDVRGPDVFLTGALTGVASFGSASVTGAPAVSDGFIARLDTAGAWRWAQRLASGPGTDYGMAVAVGPSTGPPSVWAVGNLVGGPVTIGQGADAQVVVGAGADDVFLARFAA